MANIFSPEAIQPYISDALTNIPSDHRNALVGYWTLDGKWRVTVARRIGDGWIMGATFGRDAAAGNISGYAYVKGSW